MPLKVQRRERENSQNLIRRFTKAIRQSGTLLQIRKGKFHKRPKSALTKKRSALRREKVKAEYQKLKKLGKKPQIGR